MMRALAKQLAKSALQPVLVIGAIISCGYVIVVVTTSPILIMATAHCNHGVMHDCWRRRSWSAIAAIAHDHQDASHAHESVPREAARSNPPLRFRSSSEACSLGTGAEWPRVSVGISRTSAGRGLAGCRAAWGAQFGFRSAQAQNGGGSVSDGESHAQARRVGCAGPPTCLPTTMPICRVP